jgi:hypothetical protein
MMITLAGESVIDTWLKVTLIAAAVTGPMGSLLDGEPPATGSGLGYIANAAVDLPTGGAPGGDAVFYVGSLRGDFTGDGYVTAADKAGFMAAWNAKSLDADFRGVGFGVRPPDGKITLGDIEGFTTVYLAATTLGRHLDPLPALPAGQAAAAAAAAAPPAVATSLSPSVDILAQAAGQLSANGSPLAVAGRHDPPLGRGDDDLADLLHLRRLPPPPLAADPREAILRL